MDDIRALFMDYVKKTCKKDSSIGDLRGITWEIDHCANRPNQPKNEGTNCTLYVLYYMECLVQNNSFDSYFNPDIYVKMKLFRNF